MQLQLLQTDWTQEQKNLTHALFSNLLYKNGITHQGITVKDGLVTIEGVDTIPFSEQDVLTAIVTYLEEAAIATKKEETELEALKEQIANSTDIEEIKALLAEK